MEDPNAGSFPLFVTSEEHPCGRAQVGSSGLQNHSARVRIPPSMRSSPRGCDRSLTSEYGQQRADRHTARASVRDPSGVTLAVNQRSLRHRGFDSLRADSKIVEELNSRQSSQGPRSGLSAVGGNTMRETGVPGRCD